MKILTDFDGVLTELTEEGQRVKQIFTEELSSLTHLSIDSIEKLMGLAEKEIQKNPTRHGWQVEGRVTAFANEDLFIRNNGLATCLDQWAQASSPQPNLEIHTNLREILRLLQNSGVSSFQSLAGKAYEKMTQETHEGLRSPLDPEAPKVLRSLIEQGHQVVVVSNSGTDRILNILRAAGIEAVSHDEDSGAQVRVRGNARKYALGESYSGFSVEGYRVDTSRPYYEAILKEENPDAIIGDVFSLDLALPYQLAKTSGNRSKKIKLFLRTRHYTPSWSIDFVRSNEEKSISMELLEHLERLPQHLKSVN